MLSSLFLFLPVIKGWTGEQIVRGVLSTLPKDKYIVLNDVRFRDNRWRCQIDHLIVSPYGIFCVETKNYLGTIEGNYRDKLLHRKLWLN